MSWNQECNKTITLTREHPKATVVSFGFPHQYPDSVHCETVVVAPSGYRIIIDFEELVIEKEPSWVYFMWLMWHLTGFNSEISFISRRCGYDYLELIEDSWNESYVARRLCDDMSDKLKLLRYISQGPRLKFLFVSDYSHHYGGFKARVSIENGKCCLVVLVLCGAFDVSMYWYYPNCFSIVRPLRTKFVTNNIFLNSNGWGLFFVFSRIKQIFKLHVNWNKFAFQQQTWRSLRISVEKILLMHRNFCVSIILSFPFFMYSYIYSSSEYHSLTIVTF